MEHKGGKGESKGTSPAYTGMHGRSTTKSDQLSEAFQLIGTTLQGPYFFGNMAISMPFQCFGKQWKLYQCQTLCLNESIR